MNKLFAGILIIMLLSACAAVTPVTPTARVSAQTLVVFECASVTCAAVGMVGMGDQVVVTGADVAEWTPIKYFGKTRYVYSKGLEK